MCSDAMLFCPSFFPQCVSSMSQPQNPQGNFTGSPDGSCLLRQASQ